MTTRRFASVAFLAALAACADAEDRPATLDRAVSRLVPFGAVEVVADFTTSTGVVQDLMGVNKGPLTRPTTCSTPDDREDATYLYQRAGVRSVRLHDDSVDVSGIFTARALSTMPGAVATTDPCFPQDPVRPGRYLQIDVPSLAVANLASSYDYTNADLVYAAAVAGGFDVYLRLGESWNGPSMSTTPALYGRVAAKIAQHFAAMATPPRFIEIGNEPDSLRFWQGSATDYALFYDHAFDLGPNVKTGGAGLTSNTGMALLTTSGSFPDTLLTTAGRGRFEFVSFHLYGDGIGTLPSRTVGILDAARANLDTFCATRGWATCPDLHVSEWNIAASAPAGVYGDPAMAGFTSAFLTWAQDPSYRIRAAHHYAGTRSLMGMHFGHTEGLGGHAFDIRPAAFAMSMHAGLAGGTLVDLKLRDATCTRCPRGQLISMLDFARNDGDVTAYAARSGTRRTVLVTNTTPNARTVHLSLRGLSGTTSLSTRRLLRQPPGVVQVGAHVAGTVWVPNVADVDARYADPTRFATAQIPVTPVANVVELDVLIDGYEVLRIEAP